MAIQSKRDSFIEAVTNTVAGYIVGLISQIVIFHFFNIPVKLSQNILMGLWFTLVSIVRGYCFRRWFTKRTEV